MGTVTLDMLQKLMLDMQDEIKGVRGAVEALTQKVDGMAQTMIDMRRDVRSLQGEVATLGAAIAGHSRRLEQIELRLGLTESQH